MEVESGKRNKRPELEKALKHAKTANAVLVVAKLDRLARNARFLLGIVESGVDVAFCDLPQMPSGSMGKFFLTMMAAVAELEGGMISERTKAALDAAKRNGKKLGVSGVERAKENKGIADIRACELGGVIHDLRTNGAKTLKEVSDGLNGLKMKSAMGGIWYPQTVNRLIRRLDELKVNA